MKATLLCLALLAPLALAVTAAADTGGDCLVTPTGIDCSFTGSSTTRLGTPGTTIPGRPLRYLATGSHPRTGLCWFWSPHPPGLDSWNPAFEAQILRTRWSLPECPDPVPPKVVPATSWVVSRAWQVFRSFALAAPRPALQPGAHGITGLPSYLSAPLPPPLDHREALPDRRTLEVQARVTAAVVDWGDGTPPLAYEPGGLLPYPDGIARHAYTLKTCPPAYRASHPSGGNCHPRLEAYLIDVAFRWTGRYRVGGGAWVDLGHLLRRAAVAYDVDEVIGVLRP